MKFIHTADWHLGKTLREHSLIEDQEHILMQEFLRIVEEEKAEAIVIAGDVYDRGVPPNDAVDLFDEVLTELLIKRSIPVLCIAGNHDSESRLNFGRKMFEKAGFYMRSKVNPDDEPIKLTDEFGEVYFSLIPYFNPERVCNAFDIEERISFDSAAEKYVGHMRAKIPENARCIAVTHAFITGGERSQSERQQVGGADNISVSHFKDYNYTAIGHLHRPQRMIPNKIEYSGSLLKYSFDEWQHKKGVNVVNIDGAGNVRVEHRALKPLHEVRIIEGLLEELRKKTPSDDYILARLTDKSQVLNAKAKLDLIFANLLALEKIGMSEASVSEAKIVPGLTAAEYFKDFFNEMTGEPMTPEQVEKLESCIKELEEELRN